MININKIKKGLHRWGRQEDGSARSSVKNIRKIPQGNNTPTLFEEFGGGSCTCNVNPLRSPAVIITNNDKTCTSGCTQLHEEVHEMDIQSCCEKARNAMYWPWIFDTDKYLKLMDKYYDYEAAIASWSELRAYKMSKGCLEKLKAQKKSEGKDCKCLKEIDDRLNQVNNYLNIHKTSESNPSCPF